MPGKIWCRILFALLPALILPFFIELLVYQNNVKLSNPFDFMIICSVCIFILFILFFKHIPVILCVFFGSLVLAAMVIPIKNNSDYDREIAGNPELPPVIHIILDEHIGFAGWPVEMEGLREVRDSLAMFYIDSGFRIFSKAYSRFDTTSHSMTYLLSMSDGSQGAVADNYFKSMRVKGYRTYLRKSTHQLLSLIKPYLADIDSIKTADDDKMAAIAGMDFPFLDRFRILFSYYAAQSSFFDFFPVVSEWKRDRIQPIYAELEFEELKNELVKDRPGMAYVVHLLMPHFPYLYDKDCNLEPDLDKWMENLPYGGKNQTSQTREIRYLKYAGQCLCVKEKMNQLFDVLKENKIFEKAIIIIHSDHGSRIRFNRKPEDLNDLPASEKLDGFSSLFMIKAPAVKAGIDTSELSISRILREFVVNDFKWKGNISDPPFLFRKRKKNRKAFFQRTRVSFDWNRLDDIGGKD